jgi:F-type H+/Na+-transporting ATPase subunit alpha
VGDRQTGKTSLALTAVLNQRDTGVLCVVCSIGQRAATVAGIVAQLTGHHALAHTAVVAATADDPPGLQYLAPFAAMTLAEHWARRGRHVLLVLDDLTRHARAYRELALLLRRAPGREAYPGDIFFLHARLLERACNLEGGGSVTALPLLEVEGQDLSAYIPTNLISISDGQVVLSERLARKGVLPPVDVGLSVSRVGGRAQAAALRAVAGNIRLDFAQFEELEDFARFATRLDDASRLALRRGRRVRAALRQGALEPLPYEAQLLTLIAVADGALDDVPEHRTATAVAALREAGPRHAALLHELERHTEAGEIPRELTERVRAVVERIVAPWRPDRG